MFETHIFWEGGGGLVWCEPDDHKFVWSIYSAKCPFFNSSSMVYVSLCSMQHTASNNNRDFEFSLGSFKFSGKLQICWSMRWIVTIMWKENIWSLVGSLLKTRQFILLSKYIPWGVGTWTKKTVFLFKVENEWDRGTPMFSNAMKTISSNVKT